MNNNNIVAKELYNKIKEIIKESSFECLLIIYISSFIELKRRLNERK